MNCCAWTEKLHDWADGTLPPSETNAVEAHVAECAACRAEWESLRALRIATKQLDRELAPSRDLWPDLRTTLVEPDVPIGCDRAQRLSASVIFARFAPVAIAAAIVILASIAERGSIPSSSSPAWSVASVAGAPRVNTKAFRGETTFHVGQWLETDEASRAKVAVGSIGEVNLEPNSRVRLVDASSRDHRLELARGTLHAFIWAPPRLFFVDTPSATAVDLGCAYTLTVDDRGDGLLHVTSGYVALEHGDRESIIPSGLQCQTRRGAGPGTPFTIDAPAALRRALERFDFASGGATALQEILSLARPDDSITLWHLLGRAARAQRGAVFDALARFHAPPEGVTREGIIAGDSALRRAWATELGLGTFATR